MEEIKSKRCSLCDTEKPLTLEFFHRDFTRLDSFAYTCKECFNTRDRQNYNSEKEKLRHQLKYKRNIEKDPLFAFKNNLKKRWHITLDQYNDRFAKQGYACAICKITKSVSKFHLSPRGLHGYKEKCSDCANKISREAYKSNPSVRRSGLKNRPDKLMRLYGITWEDVRAAFANQHGLCANRACGREITLEGKLSAKRAVIDHCHKSGKFRALLCSGCNAILGTIETKKNILLGLVEYADKFNHFKKEIK